MMLKQKLCLLCFSVALTSFAGSSQPLIAEDKGNQPEVNSKLEFVATELRYSETGIQQGLPEKVDRSTLEKEQDDASQFFSFQYGDGSSRAICLKFHPDDASRIYVDVNRNQKFSDTEAFKSSEPGIWFVELSAEYGPQWDRTAKQRVRIRHDKSSSKWYLSTAGIRQGKANFGGELRDAKLEDKNANGLWFDPEDRLFVDFDGNGKISRLTERIPAQGMRKIRGKVYGIAGSVSGESVRLAEVTGSGFLVPSIQLLDENAKVTSISGQLGSSSGIGIPIKSIDAPVEVPVGDWRIDSLQFEVTSEEGVFKFAFSSHQTDKTVSIADEDEKEIELLGELKLSSGVALQKKSANSMLTLTPTLTSASGCYLIGSRKGKQSANSENRLFAYSNSPQRELETGSSGFS